MPICAIQERRNYEHLVQRRHAQMTQSFFIIKYLFTELNKFKLVFKPLKRKKSELFEYIHMLGVKKSSFGPILATLRRE